MRKMKKLASMMLALVMVLAMSVTALAADITINGAQSGHTYKAYQIFTGDLYNGTLSNVVWGSGVNSSNLVTALKSASNDINSALYGEFPSTNDDDETITYTAAMIAEIVATWNDDSNKLIAFAAVVAANITETSTTFTESTNSDGDAVYTASNLADGYYLVIDTTVESGLADGDAYSRYIIEVAGSNVTVTTKTEYPSIEKDVDDTSVEVGQTVTYTLTSKVPDTTGYSEYTYKVSDTMSDGLTFDGTSSVTVKFGQTEITVPTDALVVSGNGFTLTLDMTDYQEYKGQTITITYTATVNENAVSVISTNTATLKYSNNPNDSTSTDEIKVDEEVYSAKVVVDKYADDDTTEKLDGATFVLYKYDTDETTKLYYKYTEDDESTTNVDESKVSWVTSIDDATAITTNENGAATFIGLEDGTYYLHETEAPDGYNALSSDVEVTIDGANATATDTASLTTTKEISNKSGSSLPSTGGIGTTIFYVVGTILVLGAAVLLITRRRMSKAE